MNALKFSHFDVMDNHYVPNLTIGPLVCEALRKHGVTAPIDVHLMVKPLDRKVSTTVNSQGVKITIHRHKVRGTPKWVVGWFEEGKRRRLHFDSKIRRLPMSGTGCSTN